MQSSHGAYEREPEAASFRRPSRLEAPIFSYGVFPELCWNAWPAIAHNNLDLLAAID